jgi:hypothetical protein
MMGFIAPRLRKPAAYALGGVLFAAAWPFLVTLLITGYGYLFGLGTFGAAAEEAPEDADTAGQARPPVSS